MKNKFLKSEICFAMFLCLIVLLKFVGVANVGAGETAIGLSHLNMALLCSYNDFWYKFTDYLGLLAILIVFVFAIIGLFQMVRRKSILKVDKEIVCLGFLYFAIAVLYVIFEIIVVNYRPIIMPGEALAEASFPSSHTMLVFTVMMSTAIVLKRYFKESKIGNFLRILCIAFAIIIISGRLLSGVHWFTDILGSVLVSGALLFAFAGFLYK